MRDDLHRTPALPRYWRVAVRHAERVADRDQLTYDLSRAAVQDMDAHIRPDLIALVATAAGGCHGQLFPETLVTALSECERFTCTPQEQRYVEVTRAVCLQRPGDPNIAEIARQALFSEIVKCGIEHVAAIVRNHAGPGQAREIRACLADHGAGCTVELGRQKPPKKLKGNAILDVEIGMS